MYDTEEQAIDAAMAYIKDSLYNDDSLHRMRMAREISIPIRGFVQGFKYKGTVRSDSVNIKFNRWLERSKQFSWFNTMPVAVAHRYFLETDWLASPELSGAIDGIFNCGVQPRVNKIRDFNSFIGGIELRRQEFKQYPRLKTNLRKAIDARNELIIKGEVTE